MFPCSISIRALNIKFCMHFSEVYLEETEKRDHNYIETAYKQDIVSYFMNVLCAWFALLALTGFVINSEIANLPSGRGRVLA